MDDLNKLKNQLLEDLDTFSQKYDYKQCDDNCLNVPATRLYITNKTPISDIEDFLDMCDDMGIPIDIKEDGSLPDCVDVAEGVDLDNIRDIIIDFNECDEDYDYDEDYECDNDDRDNLAYFDYSGIEKPIVDDIDNIRFDLSKFVEGVKEDDVVISITKLINPDDIKMIESIDQLRKFLTSTLDKYKTMLDSKETDRDKYFKLHCTRMNMVEETYIDIFDVKSNYINSILSDKLEFMRHHIKEDEIEYMGTVVDTMMYLTDLTLGTIASYLTEVFDTIFADVRSEYMSAKSIFEFDGGI